VAIFAKTNGTNVKRIINILKEHNLDDLLDKNINVLNMQAKNAEKLISLYEEKGLIPAIRKSPARLSSKGYAIVLARINCLEDNGVPLLIKENQFNPDIFTTAKEFEKKYGIDDRTLKVKYGETNAPQNSLTSLEENSSQLRLSSVCQAGEQIRREIDKGEKRKC